LEGPGSRAPEGELRRGEETSPRAHWRVGLLSAGLRALDQLAQLAGLPLKAKDLQAAFSGVLALPRLGPWGVAAFGLLLASLGGFAAVVLAAEHRRAGMVASPAGQVLLGSVAALAFALLNGEARGAHPVVRLGVGVYTLWYLLLAPVLALPRVLALVPAWALYAVEVLRLRSARASLLWVLPWALVVGRLSPAVVPSLWASVGLWTVLYGAAGALLWRWPGAVRVPERGVLFWSMAAVYTAGVAANLTQFAEALQAGYSALFTFLGLFWMWLAADLVDDASELAEKLTGRLRKVLGSRRAPQRVGSALATLGLASVLLGLAPGAVLGLLPGPLLRIVGAFLSNAWGSGLALCGALLLLVGLVTIWRGLRGRDPTDAAADGLASGVVLALVYWAGAQAWAGLSEVEAPSGWWPLLLASAPVLVEEVKQASKGVRAGAGGLTVAALALVGLATTAFRFAADPHSAVRTTTLYPFLGMVLWGLPHLLARLVAGWQSEVPSARLFFAGYLAALPAALLVPDLRDGSPALAVLLWPVVLRASRVGLEGPWTRRAAALLLVASGTLAFYYEPLFLPVPFVPWTGFLLQRLGQVRGTEMLAVPQLLAWAGAAVAGGCAAVGPGLLRWVAAASVWAVWNRLLLP